VLVAQFNSHVPTNRGSTVGLDNHHPTPNKLTTTRVAIRIRRVRLSGIDGSLPADLQTGLCLLTGHTETVRLAGSVSRVPVRAVNSPEASVVGCWENRQCSGVPIPHLKMSPYFFSTITNR
jgi:hypothetical protein